MQMILKEGGCSLRYGFSKVKTVLITKILCRLIKQKRFRMFTDFFRRNTMFSLTKRW
jgi:hypothetical protein